MKTNFKKSVSPKSLEYDYQIIGVGKP